MGPGGYELVGANFGDGSVRTISSGMALQATSLRCDPSGRWAYYLRSGNLQRTDIRDGTSNTILAGVQSFGFDNTGTQIYYRKSANTEIWKAALNGSGQVLVGNYSTESPDVLGVFNSQFLITRSTAVPKAFYLLDVGTGALSFFAQYNTEVTPQWVSYNARERCIYNSIFWSAAPIDSQYRIERWALQTPAGGLNLQTFRMAPSSLLMNGGWGGPEPRTIVSYDSTKAYTIDAYGTVTSFLGPETTVFGACWNGARTTIQLVGVGTPFPTGVGGVILSEVLSRNPGIVVADGVTRGTVAITSLNESGNGNLVYRVDCDNLSKLSYASANGYAWRHLITAASGLKGAIVSFEGYTGKIATILTFSKKPVVSRVGNQWKVEGDLVDVIDGKTGAKRPASPVVTLK